MSEGLTIAELSEGLRRMAASMESSYDELNALDGDLGDGDLGVTMRRGMNAIRDQIPNLSEDIGEALLKCAQMFTQTSGSTLGTLIATGLLSGSGATKGRTEVPWTELPALIEGAIAEMKRRGKGELGDKTVLDALEAIRVSIEGLGEPAAMLDAAEASVADAVEQFKDKPSRQGRARILAERSLGRNDPGMVAIQRLVEGLRND